MGREASWSAYHRREAQTNGPWRYCIDSESTTAEFYLSYIHIANDHCLLTKPHVRVWKWSITFAPTWKIDASNAISRHAYFWSRSWLDRLEWLIISLQNNFVVALHRDIIILDGTETMSRVVPHSRVPYDFWFTLATQATMGNPSHVLTSSQLPRLIYSHLYRREHDRYVHMRNQSSEAVTIRQ
jgi:hypothetical protein